MAKKPATREELKFEEEEVKMKSESEEDEVDGSKTEPNVKSEDEDLTNSNPILSISSLGSC